MTISHQLYYRSQVRLESWPCCLLKLRQMGTQRGVLPWLVRWACAEEIFVLPPRLLVGPVQTFFFIAVHYFN
jgi:hypothetical protein